MVNYNQLVDELNGCIDLMCAQIESMNTNEDLVNIIDITTTEWGLVKALMGHLDDPGASILGADRLARVTAAIAIAEAKD
jgi:hypothetical protein